MALTEKQLREFLSEAGTPSENINSAVSKIMDGHTTSLAYLREEISNYKAQAEKLPSVQKELDDLKKIAEGNDSYKSKYESVQAELDTLKAEATEKALKQNKEKAITDLFKEVGLPESFYQRALKGINLGELSLTPNNTLVDSESLKTSIQSEWGDIIEGFKQTTSIVGAKVANPPTSTGGNTFSEMTLADKMKYANEHPNDAQVTEWLKNPISADEGGNK